jgi:ABC-type multidrug transport system ATPase subunit
MVDECSGGEKRRISISVAIIHDSDLLILDEPTVGLDPVLREKIWNFLFNLTRTRNKTVLMSTHYVEEAKNSNRLGFMRSGRLIDEGSPRDIMKKCKSETLDEAFITLSGNQVRNSEKNHCHFQEEIKVKSSSKVQSTPYSQILFALTRKLFWEFKRNVE